MQKTKQKIFFDFLKDMQAQIGGHINYYERTNPPEYALEQFPKHCHKGWSGWSITIRTMMDGQTRILLWASRGKARDASLSRDIKNPKCFDDIIKYIRRI